MVSGHKDTASAPAQKELAEEVLGKLASGAEFEQIAQVYSEDSTKDNGGDWGWIERKTLAEPLEKFAFNMPQERANFAGRAERQTTSALVVRGRVHVDERQHGDAFFGNGS